jgi:hypothetical protein
MPRTISLLIAVGLFAFTPPNSAQETSSVWQYLGQRATRLSAQLPPLPASAEDWDKQRTAEYDVGRAGPRTDASNRDQL